MSTFNPETNFSPDAAAAGARPRGDPVAGSLRFANLMSGPRVWVPPEGPQPTCWSRAPGLPFLGSITTSLQINFINEMLFAS